MTHTHSMESHFAPASGIPEDVHSFTIPDVSFLGPDRVLDAAYALHVVDSATDEEREGEIYHMAKHIIDDFHRLYESVAYGGPEWVFLYSVQQIMVSLAKGIGRRKRELEDRMRAAKEKRDRRLREMSSNTIKMGFLRAALRVLMWGGLGYALTSYLTGKHAAQAAAQTAAMGEGSRAASLAAAIASILIGSFIRARVTSAAYNRVYENCESLQLRAQSAYNKGALEEYRRAKRDAARAWERYTHKKPTEWLAFDAVLAEDLAHVRDLCEEREENRQVVIMRWLTPVGHWVTKSLLFLRKRKDPPRPASLAEPVSEYDPDHK